LIYDSIANAEIVKYIGSTSLLYTIK